MAIARVSSDGKFENDGGTSITLAFTVAAGSNLLLIGAAQYFETPSVSFTYNGDAGTKDKEQTRPTTTTSAAVIYSLVNPDVGASQNAVFTKTGAVGGVSLSCADYTGVKQSGQPDSTGSASSTSASSLSYTVTTVADGCWIMSSEYDFIGGSTPNGTNFTVLQTPTAGNNFGDSNGSVGAAGSKTVEANFSASGICFMCSAAYAPAAAASTGNMFLVW